MRKTRYIYDARVVRIVDGDTVDVDIDYGMRQWAHSQRLRLYGLNAPEVRGAEREAGLAATEYLTSLLGGVGAEVVLETFEDKKGKYGRWLARLHVGDVDVNAAMIAAGHAKPA